MPEELKTKNDRLWYQLQIKVFERNIVEVFRLFRENGIEPIMIKGWAAARYYPNLTDRIFTDIDISVHPKLYPKAFELIKSEAGSRLGVDLHAGFRGLDTNDFDKMLSRSENVPLEQTSVRVLCPEDHLRVLCVHWLLDGGEYKSKLLDIFYLIETNAENFDWDKCLGEVSPTRQKWLITTIGLTKKYFGLDLTKTPFPDADEKLPRWLIKTLEKEWANRVILKPLPVAFHDKKEFFRQLKKRFPPNPIQATLDLEGEFDDRPRIFYQIGDIFYRLKLSLGRFIKSRKNQRR